MNARFFIALFLFFAGCTVQFELPPAPVITNLPDGGKVDVLPDSIPAEYSGRPRFYWEQIEQSDSTQSFAVTNGAKDGRWLRGDSMRWHTSGPFITVMTDTLATRAYARSTNGNETITLSGDVTGSGTTAITTTIATGAVGPDELASTAVTPGSYTHASITVDADGRVTAASSGTDNTGMVTFDVIGDAGTAETISNTDELYLRGQFGVNTSNSATDIINFEVDSSEVATLYRAQREGGLYILHAEDLYTTDWAVAIQTGIDSLNTLGGGILYIPPGTLELNEQGDSPYDASERYCLILKSGVHLRLHDATILKLANGQQTDANGPVNIIEFKDIQNASIVGGAITGNTAGQTGWTGGYGQTVYGCIIKGRSSGASGGNKHISVENMSLYDHFSNPVDIGNSGFVFTNEYIRVENVKMWDVGEGPSISGATNVIFQNIVVHDSTSVMAGDMTEIVTCRNFLVDNVFVVRGPGSNASSAIDIGGSSRGRISNVRGYNVTNGVSVSTDSGSNPCFNVTIEDCYFQGINIGGQYGIIVQSANTDSIYINQVTVTNMAAGFLVGASGTLATSALVTLNDCQAIDNSGQGILYQSGQLVVNGGDYSGNTSGFVWGGRQFGNSSEIIINGANFSDNDDYGIDIDDTGTGDSTAVPNIKASITAKNNAGASGYINVNIKNEIGWSDTLSYVHNTNEKYNANTSSPYVTGVKTLVYGNSSNLVNLYGGHHNQLIDVVFDVNGFSLIHGTGNISTQSGSNDSKSVGDIVTLRYDQPDNTWYEVGYTVGTGGGDNLGNHTATQNINLGASNWLSGDGDNEGIRVGATGYVGVGTAPGYVFDVLGTTGDIVRIKGTSTEVRIATNQIYTTNSELNVGSNTAGRALYIKSPTANDIVTLNGAGLVGINDNTPSFTLDINATDAVKLPVGTTAQRPTTTNGAIRYNTTRSRFEGVWNGSWRDIAIFEEVSADRYRYQGATYAYFMSPGELYHTSPTLGIGSNTAGRALYFNTPTANDVITINGASVGINDNTPDATLDVAGNMRLDGIFYDKDGDAGTSGQILKSTGSAVDWVDRTIVEANTAGSGSPNILTSDESEKVLTNEGSTAQNYHTLPTAAAGLTFTFVVQDADGIRIVANTGDTIRVAGTVSASAGYTESTTIGDVITLVAINATEWIAVSYVGTWTTI